VSGKQTVPFLLPLENKKKPSPPTARDEEREGHSTSSFPSHLLWEERVTKSALGFFFLFFGGGGIGDLSSSPGGQTECVVFAR